MQARAAPRHRRPRGRPTVLIVSDGSDVHVPPVAEAIRRAGGAATLLDLAEIPREISLSVGHDVVGGWSASLRRCGGAPVLPQGVSAVWWRRPRSYDMHPELSGDYRAFAMDQVHEAMIGVWSTLNARWVNDPWRDQRASHKPIQLSLAHEMGLELPRTLVTTSAEDARTFLTGKSGRGFVHKLLAPSAAHCPPTTLVTPGALGRLDTLRFSPVILQEFVPGIDIRVTVVGGEIFACQIDARKTSSPNDFRQVFGDCQVTPTKLPQSDERLLLAMMTRLGLVYAAMDFRLSEDGRLVFLEVNPGGQWLFVEQRTGQPIAEALARVLCDEPRSRGQCPDPEVHVGEVEPVEALPRRVGQHEDPNRAVARGADANLALPG